MVRNVHERRVRGSLDEAGALLDSLSSKDDRLWARGQWPRLWMDKPLGVGASGGHGPVRYAVDEYEPGRYVRFRFIKPAGFHGYHAFSVTEDADPNFVVLRHELVISPAGFARVSWPLFFGPMHDALIEDSYDRAQVELGHAPEAFAQYSAWVRFLRAVFPVPRKPKATTVPHDHISGN